MKVHTKIYFKYFDFALTQFIPCEVCGCRAVDIHHIDCRGMGGSKSKDTIENLMALCRHCHINYGDKKHYMDFLKIVHEKYINKNKLE